MRIRRYILLKNMFSLRIDKKLPLKKCVYLLWKVLCVKTENDVKHCLSTWVTLCPNMAERCRHKKNPPLFYLVCLRSFGALSGWAYPQYRLCHLFMIMEHSCDYISHHECKTTSIIFVKHCSVDLYFFHLH